MFPSKFGIIALVGLLLSYSQPALATSRYAYGYFRITPNITKLILLDPAGNVQTKSIDVPEALKSFAFYGSIASPTGDWIVLPFHKYAEDVKLVLYNVLSGEFREVASGNFALRDVSGTPDQHIAWSPDGKYLAFSLIAPVSEANLRAGIYLYSVEQKTLQPILQDTEIFSRIAFSQDSKVLAVSNRICSDRQTCDFFIEIYEVASGNSQSQVKLPHYYFASDSLSAFNMACELNWSPSKHYISIIPICTLPKDAAVEVYVWDLAAGTLEPVTAFMASIDFKINYVALSFYSTAWVEDTLLIGAAWGVPLAKTETQTITVRFPDKITKVVSTETVETALVNPITNDVAYRSILSANISSFEVKSPSTHIGRLEADTLQPLDHFKLTNGCQFAWSPDGGVLAYFQQQGPNLLSNQCSSPVDKIALVDMNTTRIVEFPLSADTELDRIVLVGWVRIG